MSTQTALNNRVLAYRRGRKVRSVHRGVSSLGEAEGFGNRSFTGERLPPPEEIDTSIFAATRYARLRTPAPRTFGDVLERVELSKERIGQVNEHLDHYRGFGPHMGLKSTIFEGVVQQRMAERELRISEFRQRLMLLGLPRLREIHNDVVTRLNSYGLSFKPSHDRTVPIINALTGTFRPYLKYDFDAHDVTADSFTVRERGLISGSTSTETSPEKNAAP